MLASHVKVSSPHALAELALFRTVILTVREVAPCIFRGGHLGSWLSPLHTLKWLLPTPRGSGGVIPAPNSRGAVSREALPPGAFFHGW